MAFTLGFHIILASLGVALELAQRWSKVAAVTIAVGAVTGTVLSFEFGLLWPAFTGRFGEVFGVAFAIEGIFFFLEAIFIAIYIFGWKRLSGWAHFWTGVPVVISGLGGAFSVVAVLVAPVYAVWRLRGRRDRHHRRGLLSPLAVAAIVTPIQFAVGDTA